MRGLLAHAALDRLTAAGNLLPPSSTESTDETEQIVDQFSSRVTRAARAMVPVYAVYFSFENTVREFVAETLKDTYGDSWFEKVPKRIQSLVLSRKKELEKNKWFTYEPMSDVSQLLFGDLASIISDQWTIFENFFPGQDWVKVRLNELEMSRNVIAHANELPPEEIERITRYLRDWLKQVPS